jgi:hypothetical protein
MPPPPVACSYQHLHKANPPPQQPHPATQPPACLPALQSGPSAFTPYTSHLIGQPPSGGSGGSGMLGCLAHKEWTVRRAAADALKAAAALLGPELEPDGCFDRCEPRSVCGRAVKALEACKFDKVRVAGCCCRVAGVLGHAARWLVCLAMLPDGWCAWPCCQPLAVVHLMLPSRATQLLLWHYRAAAQQLLCHCQVELVQTIL